MILCDHHIEKAIREGQMAIDPLPESSFYGSTSVDLRVGDDFHIWRPSLRAEGVNLTVELDRINLADMIPLTETPPVDAEGFVNIPPEAFVLVRTREYVRFPVASKLAARVEGKSKQARLGLSIHVTAPTIHGGFSGKITLEIMNRGPCTLKVRPNETRICQLIIEKVSGIPTRGGSAAFSAQTTPLGTPGTPRRR